MLCFLPEVHKVCLSLGNQFYVQLNWASANPVKHSGTVQEEGFILQK